MLIFFKIIIDLFANKKVYWVHEVQSTLNSRLAISQNIFIRSIYSVNSVYVSLDCVVLVTNSREVVDQLAINLI